MVRIYFGALLTGMNVKTEVITRLDNIAAQMMSGVVSALWLYVQAMKWGTPEVMAYCMHLVRLGAGVSGAAFIYKKHIEEL